MSCIEPGSRTFSMPFFRKTEVSDADLRVLVEYLVKPAK
jgi:hypothetical protein